MFVGLVPVGGDAPALGFVTPGPAGFGTIVAVPPAAPGFVGPGCGLGDVQPPSGLEIPQPGLPGKPPAGVPSPEVVSARVVPGSFSQFGFSLSFDVLSLDLPFVLAGGGGGDVDADSLDDSVTLAGFFAQPSGNRNSITTK